MKQKTKRILALVCVIIIVGLNIFSCIFAFSSNPEVQKWSLPCFFVSLILPILIFLNFKVIDFLKKDPEETKNQP